MLRVSCLLALLVLATACGHFENRRSHVDWIQEVAFALPEPVNFGGCCIGDLDPEAPGQEIAVVDAEGVVRLILAGKEGWEVRHLGQVPGEMIQCAAGDLLPERPGDELVFVGRARGDEETGEGGKAWMYSREESMATLTPLKETPSLLHAVTMADFDPERPGLELMLAGYDPRPLIGAAHQGQWSFEEGPVLGGKAKALAPRPKGGAVAALANGELVDLCREGTGWRRELIQSFDAPLARLGTRGDEIVVCDNAGRLHVVAPYGTELLFQDSDRLRGAAFIDIDRGQDGTEIATAGYRGRIVVVYPERIERGGRAHVALEVGRDPGHRFHHLAAGEVGALGPVLVCCGYAGRVIVLRPTH